MTEDKQRKRSLTKTRVMLSAVVQNSSFVPKETQTSPHLIFAHRGASHFAPENTIAAFDKAVDMDADFLELDVQRNADGELIVIHDTTLDRTTNATGPVKSVTNEMLRTIDAGSWFDRSFSGERIPTLKAVIKRYAGKIGLLIELKKPSLYPGIEQQLIKLLKKYVHKQTTSAPFIVQSFELEPIMTVHERLPAVQTAVLIRFGTRIEKSDLKNYAQFTQYVNPYFTMINKKLVAQARHSGLNMIAWTVNDESKANALIKTGVRGIVTDRLDMFGGRKLR